MQQQSGWYPDPDGIPGRLRWWDGTAWTDLTTQGPMPTAVPGTAPGRTDSGDDDGVDVLVGPGGSDTPRRLRHRFTLPRWSPGRGWQVGGLAVALVLVLALVATLGRRGGDEGDTLADTASDLTSPPSPTLVAPPLARLCQAGQSQSPPAPAPVTPAPTGPRVVDPDAGISYLRAAGPWQPWNQIWVGGVLGVVYRTGYYFVTQHNAGDNNEDYYATVLSGTVPATSGDTLHPDMRCVAQQVAEDARRSFYPQPNERQMRVDRPVVVDGHPGYVITFHLAFNVPGYDAKGELVSVLVIDVGTPNVAVLYQSIPDTHRQYDPVVDQVIASVRVP